MNWSIDFAPMLPAPFFWAAGALAVILIGYLLYRRTRGAMLRAAATALVVVGLTVPAALAAGPETAPGYRPLAFSAIK